MGGLGRHKNELGNFRYIKPQNYGKAGLPNVTLGEGNLVGVSRTRSSSKDSSKDIIQR
jgi:hypothetical protein